MSGVNINGFRLSKREATMLLRVYSASPYSTHLMVRDRGERAALRDLSRLRFVRGRNAHRITDKGRRWADAWANSLPPPKPGRSFFTDMLDVLEGFGFRVVKPGIKIVRAEDVGQIGLAL